MNAFFPSWTIMRTFQRGGLVLTFLSAALAQGNLLTTSSSVPILTTSTRCHLWNGKLSDECYNQKWRHIQIHEFNLSQWQVFSQCQLLSVLHDGFNLCGDDIFLFESDHQRQEKRELLGRLAGHINWSKCNRESVSFFHHNHSTCRVS